MCLPSSIFDPILFIFISSSSVKLPARNCRRFETLVKVETFCAFFFPSLPTIPDLGVSFQRNSIMYERLIFRRDGITFASFEEEINLKLFVTLDEYHLSVIISI